MVLADNEGSRNLLYAKMKIISNDQCRSLYSIPANSICAVPVNNGAICFGDSGSPLIISNEYGIKIQVGVVISSLGCRIGIFERITTSLEWIKKTIGLQKQRFV